MKLFHWAKALRAASLGVWLGGLVMIFIAAPIVFESLAPDRNKPGDIVGSILHAALRLKLGLAALAIACEAYIYFNPSPLRPQGWRRQLPAALLLGVIALTLLAMLWIEPRIDQLRQQIGAFTDANMNSPERAEFHKLHGISMGGALLEAVLLFVALIAGLL